LSQPHRVGCGIGGFPYALLPRPAFAPELAGRGRRLANRSAPIPV